MSRAFKLLLIAAMVIFTISLVSCGGGSDTTTPPDRPDPLIEQSVPEVSVQVVDHLYRVSGLTEDVLSSDPIFSLIAAANSSLDIAVTRINRQEVVDALLAEANTGTQIRIVTEKAYYDADNYAPFYGQLEDATRNGGNIEVRTDNEGLPRIMHARFMVIDQSRVITGSYNWETVSCEKTMGDVISIQNTGIAAAFTNQFNQMYIEGNFGTHKRNDTQHSFMVGSGNGMIEVYFGPTDQPRNLLTTELMQSNYAVAAVQQFKDLAFANTVLGWIGSSPNNALAVLVNDFGILGDQEENAIYQAMSDYIEAPTGGPLFLGTYIDGEEGGQFASYNALNHKLLFVNHGLSNNQPAIVFSTANYSDMALTQNDEVFLILRGPALVAKYWRGLDLNSTLPPTELEYAGDVQELDQLTAMYPYLNTGEEGSNLRPFNDVSTAIIFGEIANFRPTVTIQTGQANEFEDVDIDVTFEIEGTFYFADGDYGPVVPPVNGDMFEENELLNPNHRYMLVVPAGEVTVRTIVTDTGGSPSNLFSPDETTFTIGPGCVRKVNLKINQASTDNQN